MSRRIDVAKNWQHKSMSNHQTYGTCDKCFDSGPVWESCRYCGESETYVVFLFGTHEMDSITLSERLERGLWRQRADRTAVWHQGWYRHIDVNFLQTAVGRNRVLTEENRTRIFNQVMNMLPVDKRSRVAGTNI